VDHDTRLLERVKRWDEEALAEVFDRYAPAIYRYVYRRVGDGQTAQDLMAETFQHLLDALRRGAGQRTHLSAWLYRVAHNLVVDHYRRQPADPVVALDLVEPAGGALEETVLIERERAVCVRAALRQLTPLQQQVILLRYLEGMSLEDVAQVLERTVGSVKALQYRAIRSLQRLLEDAGVGVEEVNS